MRRLIAIWFLLFSTYTATLVLEREDSSHSYSARETRQLLLTESITNDRDIDLSNQYREAQYRKWGQSSLQPQGTTLGLHLYEPLAVGTALLVSPAYAIGGTFGVELLIAALTALAFALSVLLARRLVPEPWATTTTVVAALSPLAFSFATTVNPGSTAAVALAGAILLALKAKDSPKRRYGIGCAALVGALPWIDFTYLFAGLVVLAFAVRSFTARNRKLAALLTCEVVFTSLIVYIRFNSQLFGGLTPQAAALKPSEGSEQWLSSPQLAFNNSYSLWGWLPLTVLAAYSLYLLWHWRQTRLTKALPEQNETKRNVTLLLTVTAAQIVAVSVVEIVSGGPNLQLASGLFPLLPLFGALAALGLRHFPKTGRVLCAIPLVNSLFVLLS